MRRLLGVFTIVAMLAGAPVRGAFSQPPALDLTEGTRQQQLERAHDAIAWDVASGSLDSLVNPLRPSFQVTAGGDSSSVQIAAGRRVSLAVDGDGNLQSRDLTLKLAGPLNKSDSTTDLATLDGLSNSTSFALSFRRVLSTGFRPSQDLRGTCNYENLIPVVRQRCHIAAARDGVITDDERQQCDTGPVVFGDGIFSEEEIVAAGCGLLKTDAPRTTSFLGLTARIGYEQFKVLKREGITTPATDDDSRNESERPWSMGAFYGRVANGAQTSFVVGVDYQRAYKASAAQTLCDPAEADGLQRCVTGSFSGPEHEDRQLVFFEFRRRLNGGPFAQGIAWEPRITYDIAKKESGLDVPIYIFRASDGQFKGGVRAGWLEAEDEWTFAVFVGSSFSIFAYP